MWERAIYAAGEVTRVSGARVVCLCLIDQARGVRCIPRGCRGWVCVGKPYEVRQGVKLDNCQGNKFLLGLMVGQLTLWHEVEKGKVANSCHPYPKKPVLELL